ncbi:MAG: flippase-like domain-containing protein [Ignavibacteria bacterium]|nr:flippase-like domain-containing protein [Ignavibacteria bacterium]
MSIEEKFKPKNTKVRRIINISISLILLILLVYLSLKGLDLQSLAKYIVSANYWWVLLSIPVGLASHWVRALRWKTMLKPIANPHSTWNLFSAVMAGYAVNNIVPRGGELLRPYYYSKREKISFTMTFATIVVERFIDLISLLLVFVLAYYFFRNQLKMALPNLHIEKIIYPTILIIIVGILSFYKKWIDFVLMKVVRPISKKFYSRLLELFEKFFLGLTVIKQPSQYIQLALESLLIWFLYTVPLYLMFFSFSFSYSYNLGFDDAILLIIISGIGYTIAPTPGAIGFYHYLIQNALNKLYGISMEESLAYATVTHAVNFLTQVLVGGIFLLRENLSLLPSLNPNELEGNGKNPTSNE